MDITIYVDEKRYNEIKDKGFSTSLGNYFHNIAVLGAPYDTGNLRMAISLPKNTPKHIQINYNTMRANYIKFLEEGIGPVKKHKGFISVLTVGAIAEAMVGWIASGIDPTVAISPQVVQMRQSKYRPFNAKSSVTGVSEKDVLRQAGMYDNTISPQARREVSKFREYGYLSLQGGKGNASMKGKYPYPYEKKGSKPIRDRNISYLKVMVRNQKYAYEQGRKELSDLLNMRGV